MRVVAAVGEGFCFLIDGLSSNTVVEARRRNSTDICLERYRVSDCWAGTEIGSVQQGPKSQKPVTDADKVDAIARLLADHYGRKVVVVHAQTTKKLYSA